MKFKYRHSDIDRVRDAADLAIVAGDYLHLRKAGFNRLVALCPFHTEKTPSFTIDTVRQLYHCFGCQAGGNVIQLYMAMEHVSFGEAMEALADRFGAILSTRMLGQAERDHKQLERQENDELKRQAKWFTRWLYKEIETRKANQWKLNEACFRTYHLFHPAKDSPLGQYLQKRATESERRALKWAGYLKRIEDTPGYEAIRLYEEYRRRHPGIVAEYQEWASAVSFLESCGKVS